MSSPFSWSFTTGAVAQCPCSIWQNGDAVGGGGRERHQRGEPGRAVPGQQQRVHHRGPVLQGVRQHRHAYREPVDCDGTLLATGTFSNETASGWQELDFSSPVPVTAGTTYVASYSH